MTSLTRSCPFIVYLANCPAEDNALVCEQLLREVPDKRSVYRGHWQGRPVLVKMFLDRRSARRHWLREKSGVDALLRAQVNTPGLVFSGALEDNTPVLVFDFLPRAVTALKSWEGVAGKGEQQAFLCQLISLISELHEAGLVQEDLHLENFLTSGQQLYAIDGDAINTRGFGKPLDLKSSSRNLALFFAQLSPRYDSMLEETALRYAEQRKMSGAALMDQLKFDLPVVRRRRRHKYLKKCYRTCSEFIKSRRSGQVSISRRDAQDKTLRRLLDDPDVFMSDGTVLKAGNTSTVIRVQGDGFDWVIKRYNIKNLWHALRRCFRPTRAWTSWGNAHLLKISGISSPRAIAVIEKRIGPLRSTGYYVCDFVEGAHAETFFLVDSVEALSKERVTENFVHLFESLHKLNICHGDCKATNFLIRNNEPWVLDLDAMHECCSRGRFERLFQMDRKRFLRNWESQPELQQWFDEHLPGKGPSCGLLNK